MDRKLWMEMWGYPIQPKLRFFLWQVFRRILPTTEKLIAKEVEVLPRGHVCWAEEETIEHLMFFCPVAVALWEAASLQQSMHMFPREHIGIFLRCFLATDGSPQRVVRLAALLWRIWKARNWVVFQDKQVLIPVLVVQYQSQVREWLAVLGDGVAQPGDGDRMLADREISAWGHLLF
ncbi:unnamed protein product [Linum trigynum]|uniref:Reverse transcriptase zinc-binding domain-containing protein n=1 Tax=Linum trigynum TaxID=586398 RepID=A0AAV2GQZ1_9ROSI